MNENNKENNKQMGGSAIKTNHHQHNNWNKSKRNNHSSFDKRKAGANGNKDRNERREKENNQRNIRRDNRNGNGRTSFLRNNNYGFPRVENEPREERAPITSTPVDDHPRAMVLPFDQKAVEEVKPRKYTSGFEIHKISLNLARWLVSDDYLRKLSEATGVAFSDKAFIKLEGETLTKLKDYSDSRQKEPGLEKTLRAFYKYMSYFASYAIENKTAVVFDL